MKKPIVIKVGGSLLYKENLKLNTDFLDKFKDWYLKNYKNFSKVVVVVGGGKLSREVGGDLKGHIDNLGLHSVSMQITQANAEMLKGYLGLSDIVTPQTLRQAYAYLKDKDINHIVSGGLKSGWSTDMDGCVFADILKIDKLYKLSNIKGVFTADPKKDKKAKFIESLTWDEYSELFNIDKNNVHKPNNSIPISQEAAVFCQNKRITMFVSGGENIYSSKDLSFVFESGTKISP